MRLATVEQSLEVEELSEKVYGLSSEVLMEAAGALAAREIDQSFFPEIKRGRTAVVVGPGNNGGDGLVVARHLHSAGHRNLVVFYYAPQDKRSALFVLQLKRLELQGIKLIDLEQNPEKLEHIRTSTLVIDALFGIGLSRKIEGEFLHIVDMINSTRVPVVSLDAPSGLNCNTGVASGAVVKASMTLSFGLAKPGFFVADGPGQVGKLRVLPIGFPHEALRGVATSHFLFNEKLARRYLPTRETRSHKSQHGHLLVAAGRPGMWGAGVLASSSAYRMGAGYVTWASWEEPSEKLKEVPEVLAQNLNEDSLWSKTYQAVAAGPGLGVSEKTRDFILELIERKFEKVVLDADAITVCVDYSLFPLPDSWILTPHAGELSRVLGIEAYQIDNNRFEMAKRAAEVCGCHVLLKGFRSVLAYQNRMMVIQSGNSALAKAGTGDVLTGMIGGLMAQGLEPLQATATATYIHGRLADEWVRAGHDKNSLLASDLKDQLGQLVGRIAGGSLIY